MSATPAMRETLWNIVTNVFDVHVTVAGFIMEYKQLASVLLGTPHGTFAN